MIKFSLCIEPVLAELDFYDWIEAAAELGFDAIEFWDPVGKDVARIGRLAAKHKVAVSICCAKDPWGKRMNAPASVVTANVRESMQVAKDMGCHALIGHFHSAEVPGRHEHLSGENDYQNILKAIAATGYDRFFGLEYWPTYDHRRSLEDVLMHLKS